MSIVRDARLAHLRAQYISDPRRTKPEKLKTVIRFGVTSA